MYVIRVSLNSSDAFSTWASVIVDICPAIRKTSNAMHLPRELPSPPLPPSYVLPNLMLSDYLKSWHVAAHDIRVQKRSLRVLVW